MVLKRPNTTVTGMATGMALATAWDMAKKRSIRRNQQIYLAFYNFRCIIEFACKTFPPRRNENYFLTQTCLNIKQLYLQTLFLDYIRQDTGIQKVSPDGTEFLKAPGKTHFVNGLQLININEYLLFHNQSRLSNLSQTGKRVPIENI